MRAQFPEKDEIIGKYKIIDYTRPKQPSTMLTDNPREAVWEANKSPNRVIENICGERDFYKDDTGRWHSIVKD